MSGLGCVVKASGSALFKADFTNHRFDVSRYDLP